MATAGSRAKPKAVRLPAFWRERVLTLAERYKQASEAERQSGQRAADAAFDDQALNEAAREASHALNGVRAEMVGAMLAMAGQLRTQ